MKNFFLSQQKKINKSFLYRELLVLFAAYAIVFYSLAVAWHAYHNKSMLFLGILIIVILFSRFVVSEFIHRLTKRARPYQKYGFKPVESILFTFRHKQHDSFPSDHELIMTFSAVAMYQIWPRLALAALIIGPLMGLARVALGFHYITDLLGGITLGIILGLIFNVLIVTPYFT